MPPCVDATPGRYPLARCGAWPLSEHSSDYWPTDRDRNCTYGALRSVPNEQLFDCARTDPRAAVQEDARYAPAEEADILWPEDMLCVLHGLGRFPFGFDFRGVDPSVSVAAVPADHAAPNLPSRFVIAIQVSAGSRRKKRSVRHIIARQGVAGENHVIRLLDHDTHFPLNLFEERRRCGLEVRLHDHRSVGLCCKVRLFGDVST